MPAFGLIGNLKTVASLSNIFIFIVFGMVNIALINFRRNNKDSQEEKPYFFIPLNIKNIPIPTIVALVSLLILLGFNIYNLVQGKL